MVPKHLIQKIFKTSEISFGQKIHLKYVHKNTQKFNNNMSHVMYLFFTLQIMFPVFIVWQNMHQ